MERLQFAALILPSEPMLEAKLLGGAHNLSPIAGKSIHQWVVDAALGASIRRLSVVSSNLTEHARAEFEQRLDDALIKVVAPVSNIAETVAAAIDELGADFTLREATHVLLLPAQCPQITSADLRRVIDHHLASRAAGTICTGEADPSQTEPVIARDEDGRVASIADVPIGGGAIFCFRADVLVPALRRSSGSFDFQGIGADVARVLQDAGHHVETLDYPGRFEMVRSGASRAEVEATLRQRVIHDWIERGVIMADPNQVTIDATAHLGKGVEILPGTVIEGRTIVADGARIGPNTHLVDATIGSSADVGHAVVRNVEVPPRTRLAPFTVLGPTAD